MNYKLDIISQHPEHHNKALRKHKVEAIDTVGVQIDEQFAIRFTNNTYHKVQVKISLDGIDIMTGELATTEPTQEMWVVQANGTLVINAWPETDNGGAALIFSHAGNSVAIHTNGDLSHRGIIAAAVYAEGHVEPLVVNPFTITTIVHEYPYWVQPYYYPYNYYYDPYYDGARVIWNGNYGLGGSSAGGTCSTSSNSICGDISGTYGDVSGTYACNSLSANTETVQDQQSLPSVGAGQFTEQKIDHTAGLIKPILNEILQVRYLWWHELENKLINQTQEEAHPSGFPADTKKRIKLGNTPRVGTPKVSPVVEQPFVRFV